MNPNERGRGRKIWCPINCSGGPYMGFHTWLDLHQNMLLLVRTGISPALKNFNNPAEPLLYAAAVGSFLGYGDFLAINEESFRDESRKRRLAAPGPMDFAGARVSWKDWREFMPTYETPEPSPVIESEFD